MFSIGAVHGWGEVRSAGKSPRTGGSKLGHGRCSAFPAQMLASEPTKSIRFGSGRDTCKSSDISNLTASEKNEAHGARIRALSAQFRAEFRPVQRRQNPSIEIPRCTQSAAQQSSSVCHATPRAIASNRSPGRGRAWRRLCGTSQPDATPTPRAFAHRRRRTTDDLGGAGAAAACSAARLITSTTCESGARGRRPASSGDELAKRSSECWVRAGGHL